jgi:hypothetical protein
MAEFSPNFVNPAYATPEQLATQRAYAAELMKRSGQDVSHPTGALANALLAVTGGLERNRANEIQSQAAEGNASNMTALIRQLQQGQQPDAANVARMSVNPMASPEQRNLMIDGLIRPKPIEDVAGRPASQSQVAGVRSMPYDTGFQPGIRPGMSAGDASISAVPQPAPPLRAPLPAPPVQPTSRVWGDKEAQAAGLYPSPPGGTGGAQGPGAGLPPAPAPAMPLTMDALAAKGREYLAAKTLSQSGAEANSGVIKTDIAAANDAPNVLKGVGIIKDNIQRYGDKITFGPTSPWSLEMKRAAANYAPGMMKDQLNAIAAADSINKVGIGLAGTLASSLQGGSNADTFAKAMQAVPGLTTSKEGALAMADMIQQSALKQQELGKLLRDPANFSRYAELKANFFRDHPVINPLTGNPIEMDVDAVKQRGDGTGTATGGFKVLKVH